MAKAFRSASKLFQTRVLRIPVISMGWRTKIRKKSWRLACSLCGDFIQAVTGERSYQGFRFSETTFSIGRNPTSFSGNGNTRFLAVTKAQPAHREKTDNGQLSSSLAILARLPSAYVKMTKVQALRRD